MAGAAPRLKVSDLVVRFLFIFSLMLGTYNPTGYSYLHWLLEPDLAYIEVKIFIGFSLFLLHGYLMRIAWRAYQRSGTRLAVLFFASAGWALWSQDLLPEQLSLLILMAQAGWSAALAVGMALVLMWQQASGQVTATIEVH